ncbi:MAG: hypothetical protein U5K30_06570 [Acidimicrobiales bacterium]|nr:hypothetical protein [Acidimicrobiales bacterium]
MARTSSATATTSTDATSPGADAEKDWPTQATEAIVTQVGRIRDKTTGPARKAAQYAVFAAFAISLGSVALIIFLIGTVRALNNYLPDAVFGETHMWAAHSILGAVLLIVGLVLFSVKTRPKPDAR